MKPGESEADPAAAPNSHVNRGHGFFLNINPFPPPLQRCRGTRPRLSKVMDMVVLMELRRLVSAAQDLKSRMTFPAASRDCVRSGVSLKKKVMSEGRPGFGFFLMVLQSQGVKVI